MVVSISLRPGNFATGRLIPKHDQPGALALRAGHPYRRARRHGGRRRPSRCCAGSGTPSRSPRSRLSSRWLLSTTAAYRLRAHEIPRQGGRADWAMLLLQMFPAVLALVAIFAIFDRIGNYVPALGIDSHWAVILAYVGRHRAAHLDDQGLLRHHPGGDRGAAQSSTGPRTAAFHLVLLPMAVPILMVVFLLAFIGAIIEYPIASILLRQVNHLTLAVGSSYFLYDQNYLWGDFAAAAVLSGLPITVVFMLAQKWMISGLTAGRRQGMSLRRRRAAVRQRLRASLEVSRVPPRPSARAHSRSLPRSRLASDRRRARSLAISRGVLAATRPVTAASRRARARTTARRARSSIPRASHDRIRGGAPSVVACRERARAPALRGSSWRSRLTAVPPHATPNGDAKRAGPALQRPTERSAPSPTSPGRQAYAMRADGSARPGVAGTHLQARAGTSCIAAFHERAHRLHISTAPGRAERGRSSQGRTRPTRNRLQNPRRTALMVGSFARGQRRGAAAHPRWGLGYDAPLSRRDASRRPGRRGRAGLMSEDPGRQQDHHAARSLGLSVEELAERSGCDAAPHPAHRGGRARRRRWRR